ncbi:unnamed protein product [Prunus armeniaca]
MGGVGRRSQAGHFGTGPDPSGGRMTERPAKTWPAVVAAANQRRERDARERESVRETGAIPSFNQKSIFQIFTIMPLSFI